MRIGSLFSGYGGLDLAVSKFFGAETVWYSEIEPAACEILAAHYPGVQNLGDVTEVDWAGVPLVDILIGGYPCQPFSQAGHRKGKNDERHLWPFVGAAIGALRPGVVVLENVRGHVSLGLADVIGDLAGMGYDARWGVVRASDAGAPHGRARVFIVAYPDVFGRARAGNAWAGGNGLKDDGGPFADTQSAERGNAESEYLGTAIGTTAEPRERASTVTDWGKYELAIRRWEHITRPSPNPTISGTNGRSLLSSHFVEWLMGLPEGWVTGHGLSVSEELKALGNGVCPQQAFLALQLLIGDEQ